MYKMACDYLAIPASSGPSEARRNFEDRDRLHACTFKAEIYIRSWLDLLDSLNISFPEDFNVAFDNLDLDLEDMIAEDDVIEYLFKDSKVSTIENNTT